MRIIPLPTMWLGRQQNGWVQTMLPTPCSISSSISAVSSQPLSLIHILEAIQYLSDHPKAKIVAGGTDLSPRLNQKLEEQTELCYVFGYPEMHGIRKTEDSGT